MSTPARGGAAGRTVGMTNMQKAAVVLMQLGQERAAKVMALLTETEVEEITAEIVRMENVQPAVAKEAVDNMIGPKMWSEGEFSITELNRIVEGLKLIGEVKNDIDWSTVLDKSFLPADLQAKQ